MTAAEEQNAKIEESVCSAMKRSFLEEMLKQRFSKILT